MNSISKLKNINYELLIINDGSLDNSQKIIEKFYKDNDRTKFFIKENGGLSSARNYGIRKAQGKYIWFVDSDDLINSEEFEKFYLEFKKYDLDIGYFNFFTFDDSCEERIYKKDNNRQVKEKDVIVGKKYFELILDEIPKNNIVWNKIYKKNFIDKNQLSFEKGIICEDIPYTFFSIIRAKKIKYFDFYPYLYRENRKDSITTNKNEEKMKFSFKKIMEIWIENYEELKEIEVIHNKIVELYFDYLELDKKRDKKLESKIFKLNNKNFFKNLNYRRKLFKRTYIEKRYKS